MKGFPEEYENVVKTTTAYVGWECAPFAATREGCAAREHEEAT